MATYLELQQTIADELGGRQDLLAPLLGTGLTLSPVKNAIQSAINVWEFEPFWFNEDYEQNIFNTVAGQEFYTSADWSILTTAPNLLRIHVLISGNRYPIKPRTWGYLEDTSVNPSVTGQPIDYAYLGGKFRLYPIPDGAYPLTFSLNELLSDLVNDADTNAWTTDAYDLIRSQAKLILAREILYDDELAQRMEVAIYGNPALPRERGYLYALKARTTRRAKSRIQPSYF